MRYLFLLRSEEGPALSDDERAALFDKFVAWSESLKTSGRLVGVERLCDGGGHTVRKKRDVVVVDGPYAEMRELVTGLFIVEAASAEEAQRIAGECPVVGAGGSVEVREIGDFPVRP
jgi:hypothetical protein